MNPGKKDAIRETQKILENLPKRAKFLDEIADLQKKTDALWNLTEKRETLSIWDLLLMLVVILGTTGGLAYLLELLTS